MLLRCFFYSSVVVVVVVVVFPSNFSPFACWRLKAFQTSNALGRIYVPSASRFPWNIFFICIHSPFLLPFLINFYYWQQKKQKNSEKEACWWKKKSNYSKMVFIVMYFCVFFSEIVINKGQTETQRYRFLGRNGGYCWCVTQATLVYDKQKPQSVVCVNYVIR